MKLKLLFNIALLSISIISNIFSATPTQVKEREEKASAATPPAPEIKLERISVTNLTNRGEKGFRSIDVTQTVLFNLKNLKQVIGTAFGINPETFELFIGELKNKKEEDGRPHTGVLKDSDDIRFITSQREDPKYFSGRIFIIDPRREN